jgi:hypothetical protein
VIQGEACRRAYLNRTGSSLQSLWRGHVTGKSVAIVCVGATAESGLLKGPAGTAPVACEQGARAETSFVGVRYAT